MFSKLVSWKHTPPELIAFVASFVLFAVMAAPGIEWMDPGELTAAAYTLGGAHPPGHPAHTLLGKLATLLPFGEIAFRVNLLSALFMAAAVAGVLALSRALLETERVAACVAAALVALSPVTQLNATRAEVYAPVAALLMWAMVATVRFVRAGENADGRFVLGAGAACGFAAAFHPVIALAGALPMIVAIVVSARPRLTKLAPPAIALGLLGLCCYLYLPVRANAGSTPILMWGDPSSPGQLWTLLSGGAYQGNFAVDGSAGRFAQLMLLVGEGVGLTILFGGMLGLLFATISGLKGASLIAASAFLVVAGAATQSFQNPDMPGYVLPALMMLAIGLAPITGAVIRMLPTGDDSFDARGRWRHAVSGAVLLPLVAIGMMGGVVRAEDGGFRRTDDALALFSETVDRMPPGPGVYFAEGDATLFAAQYERFVAGARPDIAIANSELLRDRWFLRHVQRQQPELDYTNLTGRKVPVGPQLALQNIATWVVGGDHPLIGKLIGRPNGRGYLYQTTPPTLTAPAPPPLDFGGYVGRRVAGSIALARAEFEINSQRFDQAAAAAGLTERFAKQRAALRDAKAAPTRQPLLMAVQRGSPKRSDVFIHATWQRALIGDEIAWRAGLAEPELPANAAFERRLHLALRQLLSRKATLAKLEITRRNMRVAKQTVGLLLRTGMAHCLRHQHDDARSLWLEAAKLEPGQRPAAQVLRQLHRCKPPGDQTKTP